ncbi:MAG: hypothetical protein AAFW46_12815 [Pseudomonadota bacterium]
MTVPPLVWLNRSQPPARRWLEPVCDRKDNVEWLKDHGPDPISWFQICESWNWDFGYDEMTWIMSQPECDPVNASYILFMGALGEFEETREADGRYDLFDFLQLIVQNWRKGFYTRNLIDAHSGQSSFRASFLNEQSSYLDHIERFGENSIWTLPDAAYGPFYGVGREVFGRYFSRDGFIFER